MKKLLPKTVNNLRGFSLIELLVVISIIAILSVIGITVFSGVQKNARDASRKADIDAISKALEVNYGTCGNGATSYCDPKTNQATWFASGRIPKDPRDSSIDYVFRLENANTTYIVCADLEGQGAWGGTGEDICKQNQR